MEFIEVDEYNIEEVLSQEFKKGQIVILKFGSELCDACMALEFELEELQDNNDNISVLSIDCGESEELTQKYGVEQVPTMVVYENENSIIYNKYGVVLATDIESIINK